MHTYCFHNSAFVCVHADRLRQQLLSDGFYHRPARHVLPSVAEMDVYVNQFLWLLLKASNSEVVRERLSVKSAPPPLFFLVICRRCVFVCVFVFFSR